MDRLRALIDEIARSLDAGAHDRAVRAGVVEAVGQIDGSLGTTLDAATSWK